MQNDPPKFLIIQANQLAVSALCARGNAVAKTSPVDALEPHGLPASKIYSVWADRDTLGVRTVEENDG